MNSQKALLIGQTCTVSKASGGTPMFDSNTRSLTVFDTDSSAFQRAAERLLCDDFFPSFSQQLNSELKLVIGLALIITTAYTILKGHVMIFDLI